VLFAALEAVSFNFGTASEVATDLSLASIDNADVSRTFGAN
jgi:hypothetical protein